MLVLTNTFMNMKYVFVDTSTGLLVLIGWLQSNVFNLTNHHIFILSIAKVIMLLCTRYMGHYLKFVVDINHFLWVEMISMLMCYYICIHTNSMSVLFLWPPKKAYVVNCIKWCKFMMLPRKMICMMIGTPLIHFYWITMEYGYLNGSRWHLLTWINF